MGLRGQPAVVAVVLRRVRILLGADNVIATRVGHQIIVRHRYAHIRAREADRDALSLTSSQPVGVDLVRAALIAYQQAGEVGVVARR